MKKTQYTPEIIHPTLPMRLTEVTEQVEQPLPPEAVVGHVSKRFRLVYMYRPRVMVTVVIALLLLGVGVAALPYLHNSKIVAQVESVKQMVTSGAHDDEQQVTPPSGASPSGQTNGVTSPSPSPATPPKITAKPSPVVTAPVPAPTPAPAPNTTNCLPPNPSPYATHFISKTNSQYLQTNSYANTSKMYAALQFAGLLDIVNSKQYVVLAMDDTQWSSFTSAQLKWMNANPANMKSVIGWQIVTSCITWDGVNPVKDMANGATRTVGTLNGTVTYTHGNGGLGTFGNGRVAIWDWFTSNGSVAIAGFVDTTAIP